MNTIIAQQVINNGLRPIDYLFIIVLIAFALVLFLLWTKTNKKVEHSCSIEELLNNGLGIPVEIIHVENVNAEERAAETHIVYDNMPIGQSTAQSANTERVKATLTLGTQQVKAHKIPK